IRTRLGELSFEGLLLVASRNGLEPDPDVDRDQLIGLLTDIIDEDREEREAVNSKTVRIQQKKFSVIHEDVEPSTEDLLDDFVLPAHYEINRITLMLRDPHWAYTYWDISTAKAKEYQESIRFDGIFLRVLQLDGSTDDLRIQDSFEIPVQIEDSSWYIYLPRLESFYRIQLVARNNHRRELLAVSNEVYVPRGRLPFAPESMDTDRMALYELCGLEYLEVPPFGDDHDERSGS
ncbi:MAG: DUF4912 domain-containing protein, partial [Alkalispirochaeta sp.]